MSNSEIVVIAMILATLIMLIYHLIKNFFQKIKFKRYVKRAEYVKSLVKENKIPYTFINLDVDKDRFIEPADHDGAIIDGVKYNRKNSIVEHRGNYLYVIGKRKDIFIVLVGGFIR